MSNAETSGVALNPIAKRLLRIYSGSISGLIKLVLFVLIWNYTRRHLLPFFEMPFYQLVILQLLRQHSTSHLRGLVKWMPIISLLDNRFQNLSKSFCIFLYWEMTEFLLICQFKFEKSKLSLSRGILHQSKLKCYFNCWEKYGVQFSLKDWRLVLMSTSAIERNQ